MKPSKTRANTLIRAATDAQDLNSISLLLYCKFCDVGDKTARKHESNSQCVPMCQKQKRAPGTAARLVISVEVIQLLSSFSVSKVEPLELTDGSRGCHQE